MNLTCEQIQNTYAVPVEGRAASPSWFPILAYWIPIELREQVLSAYRKTDTRIRLRYRGPRAVAIGRKMTGVGGTTYLRSARRAYQDCLIADATHFTVYDYTNN